MISVVVPLYNKEKYISECITSVLAQSFIKFELIIIDDGSTDDSLRIANSFNDTRIRIFSIMNNGVSFARNYGASLAQYDWIAFLDADDWWDQNFLQEIDGALTKFPNEYIISTGRYWAFKSEMRPYRAKGLPELGKTDKMNYFKTIANNSLLINSSNVVIHKSLLKKYQFRNGMKTHEDHDLWMRLCIEHEVVYINKFLSFYRKDVENSSTSKGFSGRDFIQYLKDIIYVRDGISRNERGYFKRYYISFILISYFQNYYSYSIQERKDIMRLCKGVLPVMGIVFLKFLNGISGMNPYGIFKKIKK